MSGPQSSDAALCLPPRPLSRLPRQKLPAGTIDTHFHVFEAGAPLAVPRSYTPQILTLADWLGFADAVGIARGVLVQPSVYGFDNAVLLRALAEAPERLRAVVVIDPELPEAELLRLDRLGVRGVRINTRNKGGLPLAAVEGLATRLEPLGWSLQFQVLPQQLREIGPALSLLPTPVVIDHLGFIPLAADDTAAFVMDLQCLLDGGNCYVKISAPYRLTTNPGFEGFGAVAAALIGSHPERLLWGSDWPHTELWNNVPDDSELIDRMFDWLGGDAAQMRVFVTNANDLYFGR